MKLKLDRTEVDKPDPSPSLNPYESPIRWWKVTTNGDEEGRTVKDLGIHYGHVAEIALYLKDRPIYYYQFSPSVVKPCNYYASVTISLVE